MKIYKKTKINLFFLHNLKYFEFSYFISFIIVKTIQKIEIYFVKIKID